MQILLRCFGLGRRAARCAAFRRECARHHAALFLRSLQIALGRFHLNTVARMRSATVTINPVP